jgi:lipase chaperone LimK
MTRSRLLGSAALLAALLFLGMRTWMPRSMQAGTAASVAPPVPAAGRPQQAASRATPRASATMMPTSDRVEQLRARVGRSSLRGAGVDGELTLSADGTLRLDAGLVRRFDHYLSLIGEFAIDDIRELLQADLQRDHPPPVAAAAFDAFERYLGLRAAIAGAALSDDLPTRNEQLRALRRTWFGDDADAMFGTEEAHTAYTLARLALQRDPTLDGATRAARLAALDATRAWAERDAERDATSVLLVEEQSRQFDHAGTDAATRAAERTALWGEDAAQRLAQLDAQRAQWDRRIAAYLLARDRLHADPGLDAAARRQALVELMQRSFAPDERRRVESLESIGALRPGG